MTDNEIILEALSLAGRVILENGGETYRVEDTVSRMGRAFGLTDVEAFSVSSGVFLSLHYPDGHVETAVNRVRVRAIHLARVNAVNQISRQAAAGELDAAGALERLRAVQRSKPEYPPWVRLLAAGVSAGGFAVMFGGGWLEFIAALGSGMVIQLALTALALLPDARVAQSLLGGMLCVLLPLAVNRLAGAGATGAMVAGTLMPLLPGLAMTNAVQDAMRGDLLSGVGHAISALLTAAFVAGGAVVASRLFYLLEGSLIR